MTPSATVRVCELRRLIDLIELKLASLPAYSYDDRRRYEHSLNKIIDHLTEAESAKFSDRLSIGGYAFGLAGIRATCTAGGSGVLTNWIAAAHRRIAKLESEAQ